MLHPSIAMFLFWICAIATTFIAPTLRAQDDRPTPAKKTAIAEDEPMPAWRTDLDAFNKYLETLTAKAWTPTGKEMEVRLNKPKGGGLKVITDGGGGVVDFEPRENTVQFVVNEALKGKTVRWEFELGGASYFNQVSLAPKGVPKRMADWKDIPFLTNICFKEHHAKLPATELKPGQRIILEGRIGDASNNDDRLKSFHGATAIYYLQYVAHPVFFLGLEEVKITRVNPTEAQLAFHLLSDKPNLDRKAWKILKAGNRADTKNVKAIDGDESTVYQWDGKAGEPCSLVVDMGRRKSVSGIRYLPPLDQKLTGRVGQFSLSMSDSPEVMGTPVVTGTFTEDKVEQEASFKTVTGRYFKFIAHPTKDRPTEIAIAELNLLGDAVKIPDDARKPKLPPLAEEIERFEHLRNQLAEPPAALELTAAQQSQWQKVHSEAASRWYYRHQSPLSDLFTSQEWSAVNRASAKHDVSPIEDANFYAVASLPEFSNAAKRKEMAAISRGMRKARVAFLAKIKRILSAKQQRQLKDIIAATALTPLTIDGPWTDLFDGKTLSGWVGDPQCWTVKEGAITGINSEEKPSNQSTFLIYVGDSKDRKPVDFSDFELKLEYRIVGGDSGVQYRSFQLLGKSNQWRVGGYRADLDATKASVGAISDELGRGLLAKRGQKIDIDTANGGRVLKGITSLDDPATLAAKVKNAPEWNELQIVAVGNRLTHSINGVQMSKVIDKDEARRHESGLIAIELQTRTPMTIQVRRIRIRTAD